MPRILIIDDDQDILDVIKTIFTNSNYDDLYSTNARKALDIIRNNDVDLVITDILMPEFDGIELIRTLTNEFPDLKILAMSSGGNDKKRFQDYLVIAKRLGAHAIISKPINISELLETVTKLLEAEAK